MAPRSTTVVKSITISSANPFCGLMAVPLWRFLISTLMLGSCWRGRLFIQRSGVAPPGGQFLEFKTGVADSEDAKSSKQRVPFANNVDLFPVPEEGALRCTVRNGTIAKELHIGGQARRGRFDRNLSHGNRHRRGCFGRRRQSLA